jgi:serine/threonine-protein kinase
LAFAGLGLLVTGRRNVAGSAAFVAGELPHETTSKFGTPIRPRAAPQPHSTSMVTPPARGRISDGGAVRIPGASTNSPAAAAAVAPIAAQPAAAVHPAASAQPVAAAQPAAAIAVPAGTPPALFGRYRLLDRLGEGGMSELFIAEAAGVEGFTRNFVLKRLRPELAHDKEAVAQFIDEARLQASLVHSNIVPVFDFGMVGGEYFMTQEYIVGRDLSRLMSRHYEQGGAGLPPALAYTVAHDTLQALAYAHERRDKTGQPMGIVHRDVSAGNVMVSLLGEVKLGDFGIVKANRRVSRTQVGMVKGNANFMSPEQARGLQVDARSDLYSLAHVLYYALTGELLYTGENDLDILYRAATGLTSEDWIRIRLLPDPAPQILERAMAPEPGDRFQSALEFADALAVHTGGGKTGLAKLIQDLFGEELQRETS